MPNSSNVNYHSVNGFSQDQLEQAGYAKPKSIESSNDYDNLDSIVLDSAWKPRSNNNEQKPYIVGFSGASNDAISDTNFNLSQYNTHDESSPWSTLQSNLVSMLKSRVHDNGFVEAHSKMLSGADLVWARAIMQTKFELGLDKFNNLVNTKSNTEFNNEMANHQQDYNDWKLQKIYDLGSQNIHFVSDLVSNNQLNLLTSDSEKNLYSNLLKFSDNINTISDDYNNDDLNTLLEKQTQFSLNNANEGLLFGNAHSNKNVLNDNDDIQYFTNKTSTKVNADMVVNNDVDRHHAESTIQQDQLKNDSVQNNSRSEYAFAPSSELYPDTLLEKGQSQNRYWWRRSNISEDSPVSVDELMTALGSVIPDNTKKYTLKQYLTNSLSAENNTDSDNNFLLNRRTVNKQRDGKNYQLSPSNVETMVTTLSVLHDAGIDYDIKMQQGALELQLKDNSAARVMLLDLENPFLTGQVRTRENVYWHSSLNKMTYHLDGEDLDKDAKHSLMSLYDKDGNEYSPIMSQNFTHKDKNTGVNQTNTTKSYRLNSYKLDYINAQAADNNVNFDKTILNTLIKYNGLDQSTKNRLAVAPLVNVLGIDKSIFNNTMQSYMSDADIETIDRLNVRGGYQAQLNMGKDVKANIAPVRYQSRDTNGDITSNVSDDDLTGNINLNLSSAVVGDDRVNETKAQPKVDPYQLTSKESDDFVNTKFKDARINYLSMLTGADQAKTNISYADAQTEFKNILLNQVEDVQAVSGGYGQVTVKRSPLDVESQKTVLNAFKDGLLNATVDDDGVNDTSLYDNRKSLLNSTNNPILRARRLEVFDNLLDQMNQTFGTAPIYNRVPIDSKMNLSANDYLDQIMAKNQYRSQDDKDAIQNDVHTLNHNMNQLLIDNNVPAINGVDDDLRKNILDGMSYREKVQQLNLIDNDIDKTKALSSFKDFHDKLVDTYPLDRSLNATTIIEHTGDNMNSQLYGFKMAQAVQNSKYRDDLVGSNDVAVQRVQERAVRFDDDSAMTIDDLRAADKNPDSQEFKIRQYLSDVKSGKKTFSFDPKENPEPSAFNSDGTGLIYDKSKNEFKAEALEVIKKRLEARGAKISNNDLKIDKRGVIHYSAKIPMYNGSTHEQKTTGANYVKYDPKLHGDADKFIQPDEGNYGLAILRKNHRVYTNNARFGEKIYQPIEGSFGQVFAPDHDGLIRTQYNRFDGQDPKSGQLIYQARYRGWLQNPSRDADGNWDIDALKNESKNGLGINNRLRVLGYDQAMLREIRQAIDIELATRDIGDVTKYNSNTRMNKLLHGEILGDQVKIDTRDKPVTKNSQAIRETELGAVRFNDESMDATKVTQLISYANKIPQTIQQMSKQGLMQNLQSYSDVKYRLMKYMHESTAVYGNRSIGDLSNSDNQFYFSDNATGQGKMLGPLRYLIRGTKVLPSGKVIPNLVQDKDGNFVRDKDGKYVGRAVGTAIEQLPVFNNSYKNAFDRQSVAKEQFIKSHIVDENTTIATMALSGTTMEDGIVVSKQWADKHQISDQTDENGNPIMRSLTIGDKLSDPGGNKATISAVIDPDMNPKKADAEGILDIVQLFKQNNIDVASNEMSQISRNNGATAASYLDNPSSSRMSFKRVLPDENGNYHETDQVVTTNATINKGTMFVTDQTVNNKVTMDKGRKASFFMTLSDNAKGARAAGNWHFRGDNSLQMLRQMSLSMGLDFSSKGIRPADYDKLAKETSQFEYSVHKDDLYNPDVIFGKGSMRGAILPSADKFLSHDYGDNLSEPANKYLSKMELALSRSGRIIANNDQASPEGYDAGQKFLDNLPDGGVLKLPEDVKVNLPTGKESDQIYILPKRMRSNTVSMDDTTISSEMNKSYQTLGVALAKYQVLVDGSKEKNLAYNAANGDKEKQQMIQKQINEHFAKSTNIQGIVNTISEKANNIAYGGATPKHGAFKNEILGGQTKNSVTTQLSSNINLPMDVIELSPQIAKKLGFVADKNGMGHMKGHEDWTHLHVHRDPIWREQGSLGFRVKVSDDPSFKSVRVNPVMASMMDGDFDGDNVGLIPMADKDAQNDLKHVMPVDKWMLDNNGQNSLLNINAEIVEMAGNTSNEYTITKNDGSSLTGNFNDPSFRKSAIENMRPDVVDQNWIDNEGNVNVNNSDFLNAMVNNEIKNKYDQNDYKGARQKVDEIIQKTRGFDVSRDKNGEVVKSLGKVSSLQNDGVDYTNQDTFVKSLNKFADEGAKGSRDKINGLVEYMQKPTAKELYDLNTTFTSKDGVVDFDKYQKAQNVLKGVHDTQTEVQRATKTKSDATGVPGSTEQKYMSTMMDQDDKSMHDALAVGQAGTQKILSIKRDPVGAGQISETLQKPLSDLLAGKFPNNSYPTFALVGAQRNGRLGTDVVDASVKAHSLRVYKDPETGMNLRRLKRTDKFTDKKALEVMKRLDIKPMTDKKDLQNQITGFKQTVDEATEPFFRDDFMKQMKQNLAKSRKQNVSDVQVPLFKKDDKPDGIAKDEFVEMMDYIYNDPVHGMGLGVSRESIQGIANRNADTKDTNSLSPQMNSISDATKVGGNAPLVSKINMNGYSAINEELDRQDKQQDEPDNFMGKEGSSIREKYFAGMSDDQVDDLLSLKNQKDMDSVLDKNGQFDLSNVDHHEADIGSSDNIDRTDIRISQSLSEKLSVNDDDKVLLRTKDDADIVLNAKVDHRLRDDKFMINSQVQKALDDTTHGVLATDSSNSNDEFKNHVDNFDTNVLQDDSKFSSYQNNMRQKIQQRRIKFEQLEMLNATNVTLSNDIRSHSVSDNQKDPVLGQLMSHSQKTSNAVDNVMKQSDAQLKTVLSNSNVNSSAALESNSTSTIDHADTYNRNVDESTMNSQSNNSNVSLATEHVNVAKDASSDNNTTHEKSSYNLDNDMLQGSYYSSFDYTSRGQKYNVNSVRGFVSQQYLQLAMNSTKIDDNVKKQVLSASSGSNKNGRLDLVNASKELANNYTKNTGKSLFTPQNNYKFMANAYYLQMNNDEHVNNILHKNVKNGSVRNNKNINNSQKKAIVDAVSVYDKSHGMQQSQQSNVSTDKQVQKKQGPIL